MMTTRFRATVLAAVMLTATVAHAKERNNSLAAEVVFEKFSVCLIANTRLLAKTGKYRVPEVLAKDAFNKCRSEWRALAWIMNYDELDIVNMAASFSRIAEAQLAAEGY